MFQNRADIALYSETLLNYKRMDILENYHLLGLVIGISTFLIIGLFHPIVIKVEYYWGTRSWWLFLILGIAGIIFSLCTTNVLWAALSGVFAFSSLWTIKEIFEQEQRVKKGWFPRNPKRRYPWDDEAIE